MHIPDTITETIALKDQYFDLKGLSVYAAISVGSLRDYIKSDGLPSFKVRGKILIRRSEFDRWLERYRINKCQDLNRLVDGVMSDLSGA
jgi:excisionase family DNA binding protein